MRSALDRENVTDSTGRSMCFTCFLGFFGCAGGSIPLPWVDSFSAGSFGCSVASGGFSLAPLVASGGFSLAPSVASGGFSLAPLVIS